MLTRSKVPALIVMIAVAVLLGAPAPVYAQKELSESNTVITSKSLTFDYGRSVAIFKDDVVAVDPQVRIECDKLAVMFDGTNQVKAVTALGNVRMIQEDKKATCDKAVYVARVGEIVLTGNATLYRGKDVVKGERIVFWLNDDRMECTPGQLIIAPTKGKGGNDKLLPGLGLLPSVATPAKRKEVTQP
ncbi:MAG: LptA/OstA family protein [Kiritimatiellia bacterium]|jgi:lipopolysaccharide export system protein LptA|nr:LptA/OstA family protein [Kiritimatiellia bacterium]MDP6848677.1 LptA/OstA family protein [Kiritimatiellia bacterium]